MTRLTHFLLKELLRILIEVKVRLFLIIHLILCKIGSAVKADSAAMTKLEKSISSLGLRVDELENKVEEVQAQVKRYK